MQHAAPQVRDGAADARREPVVGIARLQDGTSPRTEVGDGRAGGACPGAAGALGITGGGNTDGGKTDGGKTGSGNTGGGKTDGGKTDGGKTDGGETGSGNTGRGKQPGVKEASAKAADDEEDSRKGQTENTKTGARDDSRVGAGAPGRGPSGAAPQREAASDVRRATVSVGRIAGGGDTTGPTVRADGVAVAVTSTSGDIGSKQRQDHEGAQRVSRVGRPKAKSPGPRRRQWGGDRRERPSSILPPPISERRVALARVAIVATVLAWVGYFVSWLDSEFIAGGASSTRLGVEAVIYLVVVTLLTASALAYLICRLGYLLRSRGHRRVPRAALDEFFEHSMPTMTVIVPSYREETRVIRTTLLSAALQEYPYLRVVLLVDDPPNPSSAHHRELLAAARALPGQIEAVLAEPREYFGGLLETFERNLDDVAYRVDSMLELADAYDDAVAFLDGLAEAQEIVDHSDTFFADHVVRRLAADLAVTAAAVRAAAGDGVLLPAERQLQLYRRLAWIFRAELSSFERKQYASLSHEPNKAMNLNSYIGLMGGSYRDVVTVSGRVLLPAPLGTSDLDVPDPDYVLTLDADSVLLPEYCLRLVYLMEQSEFARVAVAQTPYSAYPGAATRLERIAGATTDLQHIVHQGMTHYDATFWVGANAVLRKRALDEIADVVYAGNFPVRRYIRDRTVIEDTESTIDLATKGWTLYNYPERLSYSATPPDFGALCIQRRRWANGGLLILPKLRRQLKERRARGERTRFGELFLRTNYMASIAWASVSLLFLLAFPFANRLVSPWLGLIALPYFAAMASDLRHCGYKAADAARIYGFNLVLTPVNLAGVGNSIVQGLTGDKSVFGRTPKVRNRTIPNLLFIVTPYLIVGLAAYTLFSDWEGKRWDNLVYAALNTVLTIYAIAAYIGLRHSIVDTWVQLKARLYRVESAKHRPVRDPAAIVADPAVADWASVLYFGSTGASPLVGTVPMAAQRGRAAPVTLARPAHLASGSGGTGWKDGAGANGAGAKGAGANGAAAIDAAADRAGRPAATAQSGSGEFSDAAVDGAEDIAAVDSPISRRGARAAQPAPQSKPRSRGRASRRRSASGWKRRTRTRRCGTSPCSRCAPNAVASAMPARAVAVPSRSAPTCRSARCSSRSSPSTGGGSSPTRH